MKNYLLDIRKKLKENADERTKISSQRFFKEVHTFYGVKGALVHKISKEIYKEIKHLGKEDVFGLCEELWKSGIMEETIVACNLSYYKRMDYEPVDFELFKRWIGSYINNWASCDTFCNHTVGAFIEMYPDYLGELMKFTRSENRWMRRAAAVSLIVPAKKGMFLNTVFRIADSLLMDQDDMVQKGYGWMLKVTSHSHQQEVFDYVMKNKSVMPRTALRYSIEKMPKELKTEAMSK